MRVKSFVNGQTMSAEKKFGQMKVHLCSDSRSFSCRSM